MLKTNNKQMKEAVKNYIIECINEQIEDSETLYQKVAVIIDWYYSACAVKVNKYGYLSFEYDTPLNEALTNNLGIFTFYHSQQKELIKEWLQETEEEANRYSDDKIEKLFMYLTGKAFSELMKAYGLEIIETPHDLEKNNRAIEEHAPMYRLEIEHQGKWTFEGNYKYFVTAKESFNSYIEKGHKARIQELEDITKL